LYTVDPRNTASAKYSMKYSARISCTKVKRCEGGRGGVTCRLRHNGCQSGRMKLPPITALHAAPSPTLREILKTSIFTHLGRSVGGLDGRHRGAGREGDRSRRLKRKTVKGSLF
jgi:hypothetical protein